MIKVSKYKNGLFGEIKIPSDKSISQRALIVSTLLKGNYEISNLNSGFDCLTTAHIVQALGVNLERVNDKIIVHSNGIHSVSSVLNCGNSGTCMRILSGVLAGQNFNSILVGDKSLSKRPMRRIIEPLKLMGANISSESEHAPLRISGANLRGIEYSSPVSSAQVKSCILLAGCLADGNTIYTEKALSRNHTEIMLKNMGANIEVYGLTTKIAKSILTPCNIYVPGDFSSAAFIIVAALVIPNSRLILKEVGLNPTRIGFIEILKKMGAEINILSYSENNGEPFGDIEVRSSNLQGICIEGAIIPNIIDELPLFALLGVYASGQTIIKDALELRQKETDRISALVSQFKKLGVNIEETPDGFIVEGNQKIKGGIELDSFKDHRIAMCLYIAGLVAEYPICIKDFDCVKISFPEFLDLINKVQRF